MAKSNRRKKQDRAKAAAGRAERERARAKSARRLEVAIRYGRMIDASTSPAEVAELLGAEELAASPVACTVLEMRLAEGVPAEDLAETARLVLASAPEPPGAGVLAIGAWAAHQAGDEEAEQRDIGELLAAVADNDVRLVNAISSIAARHPGLGCELIEPYLREHPDDDKAARIYADAIQQAHIMVQAHTMVKDEDAEREHAALSRFANRDGIEALRKALGVFLDQTDWGSSVRQDVDHERKLLVQEPPAQRDMICALGFDIALHNPGGGTRDDDQPHNALLAFAAQPDVPPELAARALAWEDHVQYGIWQVRDPDAAPGLRCTDLLSQVSRYAQFPPAALDQAAPWAVWLGGLVPVDGIWRSTGNGLWLSPMEGDAIAEFAEQATKASIGKALSGDPHAPHAGQTRFGFAEPYGVLRASEAETDPGMVTLTTGVMLAMTTGLAAQVCRKRSGPLRLTNTDGEEMVNIAATIAIRGDATDELLGTGEFTEDDEDDRQLIWWGERVPYDGFWGEGLPGQPTERYLRGRLTPGRGLIQVQVNSRHRLTRLIRTLTELGCDPRVTEERRTEPSVDFAWGPVPDGSAGWEKRWLDQAVIALDSRTPRQAASGDSDELLQLESLLRQLEYQSACGEHVIDVAWLRRELGAEAGSPGAFGITGD